MINEKEIAEYRSLCTALEGFLEKYTRKKQELRVLLEETAALRRAALLTLSKANRFTRHLTGRQRHTSGITYNLVEIKTCMNRKGAALFQYSGAPGENEPLPGIPGFDASAAKLPEDYRSLEELRKKELLVLGMIDSVRGKILQLEVLELRCRELILSINKALQAFRHEYRVIYRKIYPFGIFSLFHRNVRTLWGRAYFTLHDMENIAAIGNITGHVLKIADSPII